MACTRWTFSGSASRHLAGSARQGLAPANLVVPAALHEVNKPGLVLRDQLSATLTAKPPLAAVA
jgi:hypothetical protein